MSDNIFAETKQFTSLEQFARFGFELLKFHHVEEHYSANYWGEQYFLAHKADLILTIAAQDDVAFEKYDYWLSLEATSGNKSAEVAAGQDLARTLALNGFEVARPDSDEDWLYDKSTARRIVYRRHGSNADDANRAISIEKR